MKSTHESLALLRRRARIGIAVEAVACLAGLLIGFLLCSYTLDRWLWLERGYRMALLLGLLVASVYLLRRRLWRPLQTTLDDDELAAAVERGDPGLHQVLVSAVEFEQQLRSGDDRGESTSMMRSVVDSLPQHSIRYLRALDSNRVLRFASLLLMSVATASAWFLFAGADALVWAERNLALSDRAWPRATSLHWVDAEGTLRIAEREDLRLRVEARGQIPERVELRGHFAGGQTIERVMDQIGTIRFATTLETLLDDLELVAVGGDGQTPPLRIALVARPRITGLRLRIDYPAYLGREGEELDDSAGDLRVPAGSRLTWTANADKPLARAGLQFEQQRSDARLSEDARSATGNFVATESGELRFELLDRDDLGPIAPPQLRLEVVPDAAPELDFQTRGVGSAITVDARIPGLLRLRDDYGLSSVSASFRLRGGTDDQQSTFQPAPLVWLDPFRPGAREAELETLFDLRDLRSPLSAAPDGSQTPLRPGMLLTLRFEAADIHQPEAQTTAAEDLHLRIVSREELLEDLQRGQLEQRRELAALLEIELDARDELSELPSTTGDEPRAAEARQRAQALSRQQLSLAERTRGIAGRYRRLVEEMENNRLLETSLTAELRRRIVDPLDDLGQRLLPDSAPLVDDFAGTGSEPSRAAAQAAYDRIIARMRELLARMERSESLTALIDALRGIIRAEDEVSSRLEELLRDAMSDIFDEEPADEQGR